MRFITAFAAAFLFSLSAAQAGKFDLGTVELSGSGSVMSTGNDDYSETMVLLQPEAALYLAPFLNLGPMLGWSNVYVKSKHGNSSSTNSSLSMGGKIGFLVPWSEDFGRPLPFFDLGLASTRVSYEYAQPKSKWGGLISGKAGIKLKIGECFYLSLFEQYSRQSVSSSENQFTSGFSFSGLIGK